MTGFDAPRDRVVGIVTKKGADLLPAYWHGGRRQWVDARSHMPIGGDRRFSEWFDLPPKIAEELGYSKNFAALASETEQSVVNALYRQVKRAA